MKPSAPDKDLVARRFARHRESYRRHASVQAELARELAAALPRRHYRRVLEFGVGDGLLTEAMLERFTPDALIRNDLVPEAAAGDGEFLAGDIETLALPGELDLAAGNAVWQWLTDPAALAGKLAAALTPGGAVAVSSFGIGNLAEISSLLPVSLDYRTLADFRGDFEPYFEIAAAREWERIQEFPSVRAVLEELKYSGVTGVGAPARWTRGRLAGFEAEYRRRFATASGGVTLTWRPMFLVGVKK